MLTKKCIRCKKVFIKKPSEGLPYWKTRRFCSVHCSSIGKPGYWKGKVNPYMLGNLLSVGRKPWNKGLNKYTDKRMALLGKKSGASRMNKSKLPFRIMNGYKWTFEPKHPRANSLKLVLEQVLIMEKYLGRYLKPKEVIHHINGNKMDNRIENLKLFKHKIDHMRWHCLNDKNNGFYKYHLGHSVSKKTREKISNTLKDKH